ncbi:hypothetical protein CXB51_023936 [Gossypium anomalum]|uniref:Uncharacterized protein n=1 Tax=Gossypium anomalum TaxID=47600 RepID=A0A8J5Y9I9_9ROSI|nr:hypothetical protein CXB51_023936 [Gossypium anomalum]
MHFAFLLGVVPALVLLFLPPWMFLLSEYFPVYSQDFHPKLPKHGSFFLLLAPRDPFVSKMDEPDSTSKLYHTIFPPLLFSASETSAHKNSTLSVS